MMWRRSTCWYVDGTWEGGHLQYILVRFTNYRSKPTVFACLFSCYHVFVRESHTKVPLIGLGVRYYPFCSRVPPPFLAIMSLYMNPTQKFLSSTV